MYLQIVDWLIKFIGILNDKEKLSSSVNRKKVGKSLLELYVLLSSIMENATKIRAELTEMQQRIREGKSLYFEDLNLLLGDQRQLLNTLQKALKNKHELIDIYGDNCGDEIRKITDRKISLIDVITLFSLHSANNLWVDMPSKIYIPKSFDLNDIDVFREELQKMRGLHNSDFQGLYAHEEVYDSFAAEVGKDRISDEQLINLLLSQIDNMKSVERISGARNSIAGILKTYFKIEELF